MIPIPHAMEKESATMMGVAIANPHFMEKAAQVNLEYWGISINSFQN